MSQAIRSFASGLTEPPVAPVPPVVRVPRPKTPHGNSPSGPKPTTRRSRPHANGRRPPSFRAQYALRSGVESSLSQGVRRFDLRQSRYIGLARTHLQHVCTATAMNVVRVIAWLHEVALGGAPAETGTLCPSRA